MQRIGSTKASRAGVNAVDNATCALESEFGKMKVARGSCYEFLGKFIARNENVTFDLGTPSHLKEAIEELGERVEPTVVPARSELFVADRANPLADERIARVSRWTRLPQSELRTQASRALSSMRRPWQH